MSARIVEIEFRDSHSLLDNWSEFGAEEVSRLPGSIRAAGYVIHEDETWLVLAVGLAGSFSVGRLAVPRCSVLETHELRPAG